MGQIAVKQIFFMAGVSGFSGSKMYVYWNTNPVVVYAFSLDIFSALGGAEKYVELSNLQFYQKTSGTQMRFTVTNLMNSITYFNMQMSWASP